MICEKRNRDAFGRSDVPQTLHETLMRRADAMASDCFIWRRFSVFSLMLCAAAQLVSLSLRLAWIFREGTTIY